MKCFSVACLLTFLSLLFVTERGWSAPAEADEATIAIKDDQALGVDDLMSFSLEELMQVEVISVTKSKHSTVFNSPAAIHVITNEDMRRSGYLTLPEQLRVVPGLYVGRIDGGKWAVTSRDFSGRFGRKMLVQRDGRTLYSPTFSGVFWEAQDYPLQDLDRIEVVRGPGSTLWGANAVNGIINIVSKSARETQGFLVSGGGGSEFRGFGTVRYGGQLSDRSWYRVFGKHTETDTTAIKQPHWTDDTGLSQTGFRYDWGDSDDQRFMLQGDFIRARIGGVMRVSDLTGGTNPIAPIDTMHHNSHMVGRWEKKHSENSSSQLQLYYDYSDYENSHELYHYKHRVGISDIDYQNNLSRGQHQLVWGMAYRHEEIDFRNDAEKFRYVNENMDFDTVSAFIQDTVEVLPQTVDVTVGTKFDYNQHTHFEYQPSARASWKINERQFLWGAVSRGLVEPSVNQEYSRVVLRVLAPGVAATAQGSPDLVSEEVVAYEMGYRARLHEKLSLDAVLFYNRYRHLLSFTQVTALALVRGNDQEGKIYGCELSTDWQVAEQWRLSPSYSFQMIELRGGDESFEEDAPNHQVKLRSYYKLLENLEWNSGIFYADNIAGMDIPRYTILNTGVTWYVNPHLEFALWGQNLLDKRHEEFGEDPYFSASNTEMQSGVYASLTCRF